mmetsp:Transcript_2393/g.5182  ORF Transcript_2393/g.5182 Transcript_2393/m.5182 type:complete len:418 (+) Transcript_2393:114-1367(+)
MCCSCCCPPAITALFYLWLRSGFSKGTVAGALTFFPPDPPLYKFIRIGKNGDELPDHDDEIEAVEETEGDIKVENGDDDDSDLGTFDIDKQPSNGTASKNNASNPKSKNGQDQQEAEAPLDPITQMTERSNRLRRRAKIQARRDAADAKNGVTYRFVHDAESLGELPSFNGTITAVKVGPQKKTGTYIAALLYKLPASEITVKTKTILYSHGNAADLGAMSGLQCVIAKNLKCNVLVYDYSGYGESGGIPMEKNTYRDVKMMYEWAVNNITKPQLEKANNTEISPEQNIILYGQSVGSGPSCFLASRRSKVGGLILHSPFTSGMRVLTPSRALACLDIFPNIDRIKKVNCPVFIIHGQKDQEVAFEHGQALQAAVPDDCTRDPWWVPDKGHNDICDGPGIVQYIQRLNRFMRSLDEQ